MMNELTDILFHVMFDLYFKGLQHSHLSDLAVGSHFISTNS